MGHWRVVESKTTHANNSTVARTVKDRVRMLKFPHWN